MTFILKYIFFG